MVPFHHHTGTDLCLSCARVWHGTSLLWFCTQKSSPVHSWIMTILFYLDNCRLAVLGKLNSLVREWIAEISEEKVRLCLS